ncbi:MAG: peptidase M17 [Bacteroidales bacterium]|nr:peptidase M17 [Bacteroidales bacterium]
MQSMIQAAEKQKTYNSRVFLCESFENLKEIELSKAESEYVARQRFLKKEIILINRFDSLIGLLFIKPEDVLSRRLEQCRKAGNQICSEANNLGFENILLIDTGSFSLETMASAEGLALSNYQFLKYRKDAGEKQNSLNKIFILSESVTAVEIDQLNILIDSTCWARDLVNEPVNKLNAIALAESISSRMRESGGKAEVFNKKKIEALKMGGLLSVNLGSIDPPTFTILEWSPENAINSKPYILVGKGVVYDTGGMSLKPTSGMDTMKCDMAGGALVSAAIAAIAKARLPVHVVALIPATDNRPDGNAYVPGDVITMFDGTTVEVLNTDAEGRLILADALSYAKKYDPALVINFATLTGAASRAIGPQGIVAMQVNASSEFETLTICGDKVFERLVQFPMWDEYKDQLKSEIADLKNVGGAEAGAITAGKFLEYFTDYPFIHMDIAGPAYLDRRDNYRGIGGTGIGVRLLFEYFKNMK